ncbi:RES family NAD+ phosphorylase [Salipiger thiooxidans]|uniref:RES family NAD+ phosphorylase n=1 Tax=Salipiger thiooxidans TaxID=282683 RepID=UPI001CD69399|nr:RES family NAD+ phosphorylase [Salipiger thiooxidans]MCA0849920.1 RES family NAD+ phosphorylase [Salipiger thiooxidans]
MTISYDEHEDLTQRNICFECIGDSYLSGNVETGGQNAECFYCKEEQACISLEGLADRVEGAFETHFARTADEPNSFEYAMQNDGEINYEWYREGQEIGYAIMDAASLREEIAMDVRDILEFRHEDWDSAAAGMECEFSAEAHYEEIMPEDHEWHEQWNEFEKLIKTEARFFSRTAASHLGKLFDHIDQMHTRDGKSLVVDAGPGTEISELYRGRVFQSEGPLLKAMQRPDLELAAPPAWAAGAGRMNARGISVFYGATSPEIALAEVRPPVGSRVAMARFEIIRPLKLLDLAALGNVMERGSIFDPDYAYRLGRMRFLSALSNKMARPVMPDDQEMEYLPTQAIADYLSTEGQVPLDGIVFPSVQVGGNGLNVVLFHKASRAEVLDIPEGTAIRARTYSVYAEGPEPDYSVTEEVPPAEEKGEKKKLTPFDLAKADWNDPRGMDPRDASLRIDVESVRIHEVGGVKIETYSHAVSRYRFESRGTPF